LLTSTVSATASTSPLLERKIVETGAGLQAAFARHLSSISENNAITIIEYIAAMKSEVNLSYTQSIGYERSFLSISLIASESDNISSIIPFIVDES
jgi:hypothetical protein